MRRVIIVYIMRTSINILKNTNFKNFETVRVIGV